MSSAPARTKKDVYNDSKMMVVMEPVHAIQTNGYAIAIDARAATRSDDHNSLTATPPQTGDRSAFSLTPLFAFAPMSIGSASMICSNRAR
jgi:hypothetical protein